MSLPLCVMLLVINTDVTFTPLGATSRMDTVHDKINNKQVSNYKATTNLAGQSSNHTPSGIACYFNNQLHTYLCTLYIKYIIYIYIIYTYICITYITHIRYITQSILSI